MEIKDGRKKLPGPKRIKRYLAKAEVSWKKENPMAGGQAIGQLEMSKMFAKAVLPMYFKYWKKDLEEVEWDSLEGEFKLALNRNRLDVNSGSTWMRGKMDGSLFKLNKKGKRGLWLFETKTKGRVEEGILLTRLPLDFQVHFYLTALRVMKGKRPRGVIYNIIRRPQIRQKKNESMHEFAVRCSADVKSRPEFYFFRYEVTISNEEMQAFRRELIILLRRFWHWSIGATPSIKNRFACETKYGLCNYINICTSNDYTGLYKRKRIFAELEGI